MAFAGIEKMINGRMVGLDDPLKPEDISYVLEVGDMRSKWFNVGLMLGVEISELEAITEIERNQRITSVYNAWLNRKTYPYFGVPTLKRLACVLGIKCGGAHPRMAVKLIKAFEEEKDRAQVNWDTFIKKEHGSIGCPGALSYRIAKKLFLEYRTCVQQTLKEMENVRVDIDSLDDADHFFAFLNNDAEVVQSWNVREAMLPFLRALLSHEQYETGSFLLQLYPESTREHQRVRDNKQSNEEALVFALWYWIKNADDEAFSWKNLITAMAHAAGGNNQHASTNYYHIFKNCTGKEECDSQREGWMKMVGIVRRRT